MSILAKLKGYRTVILHTVQAVLGVLATVNWEVIAENPRTAALITIGVSLLTVVLRFDTDGPVGRKPE